MYTHTHTLDTNYYNYINHRGIRTPYVSTRAYVLFCFVRLWGWFLNFFFSAQSGRTAGGGSRTGEHLHRLYASEFRVWTNITRRKGAHRLTSRPTDQLCAPICLSILLLVIKISQIGKNGIEHI